VALSAADLARDTDWLIAPLAPAIEPGAPSYPLAGGPLRFSSFRVIAVSARERLAEETVPVHELDSWREGLPAPLRSRFDRRFSAVTAARAPLSRGASRDPLTLSRPRLMGVVNVTPDSFSDGGHFAETEAAIAHGEALIEAGADILDIGGESTRPGAEPVPEPLERERVLPVIAALRGKAPAISIDSRKAAVLAAALEAGADILNDVSALTYDPKSLQVAAQTSAPVILMHARGDPAVMQRNPDYADALVEIAGFLDERVTVCEAAGIARERLIVDPGIGFGKTVRHNLELIGGLAALHSLATPVLLGASRKRFIGALSREERADRRMPGSIAAALAGADRGAQILRVHDVGETAQALAVWQGLADTAGLRQVSQTAAGLSRA